FGEYKNKARAMYANKFVISNEAIRKVKVLPDPVFDYSTIIGKVFNDKNGNRRQDPGENGINGVKITTEDGIVVITDQNGQYHIAGLKPVTKLIKVDMSTLPLGSSLTTRNPYIARFTLGGTLARVNFGVSLSDDVENLRSPVEVVMAVELSLQGPAGRVRLKISGVPVNLKWTAAKEPSDKTALMLRAKIENLRNKSDAAWKESEQLTQRKLALAKRVKKTTRERVKRALLKRVKDLGNEIEVLRQQANELQIQADMEAEKIKGEAEALEVQVNELTKEVRRLSLESRDERDESEELRTEAEAIKNTDQETADVLLLEANDLRKESREKDEQIKELNREIMMLRAELTKQKFAVKKPKQSFEFKINGQAVKVDLVKGYRDDVVLAPDVRKIDFWLRDLKGRETRFVKAVSIPKLEVSVYRSDEKAILLPDMMVALTPEVLEIKTG
ncbi:MAG: hypothetical protein KAI63_08180, partial [Planctomycetes bacterium]|nr:hypothetical protein [Planctomycetota bacterium]